MPKVLANGIQIHYQQAGAGQDLVLIHPVAADLSLWYLHVMPALAKEFRVTAYDMRGHGYSEATPSGYTSAHMAEDLHGLLVSLGIERAHLVGYSFGGSVALHCAVLYPTRVASLVLADPAMPAFMPMVDLERWAHVEDYRTTLKEYGMSVPEDRLFDLECLAPQILHAALPIGLRRGLRQLRRKALRTIESTSVLREAQEVAGLTVERIAEVRHPALALYGKSSPFLQMAWYLQEKVPSCQVVVVEDSSHFFTATKPQLFLAGISDFLRQMRLESALGAVERGVGIRSGKQ
jgi:pimeloyl-ACP methyl ester carboxylesterase